MSEKEQLKILLHRGWEIEKKFESLSSWKAFVTVGSNFRNTILTLILDEEKHRSDLEKLIKGLNLGAPAEEIGEVGFDFCGKCDAEILEEVAKQDEIARDLYSAIEEKTDPKLVTKLSGRKDTKFFYQKLNQMVEDEKRHIEMLRKLAPRIRRIM